ncbi:MAG: OmpP1/FadL family transporter [Akkermansiaceae bacterium]
MKKTHALVCCSLALSSACLADGFRLAGQSPEAVGKGNAFVATANTAAAVYYNAAGLTQLDGSSAQVGFYNIVLDIEGSVAGGKFEIDKELQTAPQIYSHFRVNEKFVMGVGLNSPFGLATDWGDSTSFRTTATSSEVIYATLWVVGAYQLSDTLSVGGGIGIHHADVTLNRGVAAPGDEFSFSGNDQALSWTLSLLWQPSEKHSFGMVYRSQTDFTLKGKAEAFPYTPAENGSVDFITPATFAVGYSYRPNKCWNIEANIEWADWSQFDTLVLEQSVSPDLAIPFAWEDALVYSLGAEYDMGNGYQIRFGYNLIESAQPDANFTPGVADADRHWLTFGVGHKGESWSWDAAYQYGFSDRTVGAAADPSVQGKYKSRFHSLSFSARYEF